MNLTDKFKKALFIMSTVMWCMSVYVFLSKPRGQMTHITLPETNRLSITSDQRFFDNKSVNMAGIEKTNTVKAYIESLDVIMLTGEEKYGYSSHGAIYHLYCPQYSLTLQGDHITISQSSDGEYFNAYYLPDCGYNRLTGTSNITRELDKLISENKS